MKKKNDKYILISRRSEKGIDVAISSGATEAELEAILRCIVDYAANRSEQEPTKH